MTLVSSILCVTPHSPEPLQGRECSGLEPPKPEAERQYPKFPSQLLLEDQGSPVLEGKVRLQLLTPEQGTVLSLSGRGTFSLWH